MISRMLLVILGLGIAVDPVSAASVIATHSIPARTIIAPADIQVSTRVIPGALTQANEAIGLEARVTIYAGRPVRAGDIGPPALIERNAIVRLRYAVGALVIEVDGRALARGAVGDTISVMNLASRSVIVGRVSQNGLVEVKR